MINLIGKTLVVFNVALSMVVLTFSLGLFTNQMDWGWKEPRQELGMKVPSEIDKRMAAVQLLARHRITAETALETTPKKLAVTEQNWAAYHLDYANTLNDLVSAPADKTLDIKKIKVDPKNPGDLFFNPTQPGKPVFEGDVVYTEKSTGKTHKVEKSFAAYDAIYQQLQKEILDIRKEIGVETAKMQGLTEKINGVYDPKKANKLKPGIQDLLEDEKLVQKQVKKEMEDIEPLWVRKLVEAQLMVARRQALEARLKELQAKLAEKK